MATACNLFLVFGVSGVVRGAVLGVFGVVPEEWPSCGGRGLLAADPEALVFLKECNSMQFNGCWFNFTAWTLIIAGTYIYDLLYLANLSGIEIDYNVLCSKTNDSMQVLIMLRLHRIPTSTCRLKAT